jgi:hypothetical protein
MISILKPNISVKIEVFSFNKKEDDYKDELIKFLLDKFQYVFESSLKSVTSLIFNTLYESNNECMSKTYNGGGILQTLIIGTPIKDYGLIKESDRCIFKHEDNYIDYHIKNILSDNVYFISYLSAIIIMDEENYNKFVKRRSIY